MNPLTISILAALALAGGSLLVFALARSYARSDTRSDARSDTRSKRESLAGVQAARPIVGASTASPPQTRRLVALTGGIAVVSRQRRTKPNSVSLVASAVVHEDVPPVWQSRRPGVARSSIRIDRRLAVLR